MKFTHRIFTTAGWVETDYSPSDYEEVKHLGECPEDGDVFVAYDSTGHIHIFKGVLNKELKINTWYRNKHYSVLVYRTEDIDNYGIKENEERIYACFEPKNWKEATEEEVKETLIKLAKKKGFKNIHKLKLKDPYGTVFEKGELFFVENEFTFYGNTLYLGDVVMIFNKGKWAEILEEEKPLTILAIEERLKRLEEKINGNDQ